MYHAVGTNAFGDERGIFSVSPEQFRAQVRFLHEESSARIVGLSSGIVDASSHEVAITFDDGYVDNLEVAAPILADYGLPFTVFVTADFSRQSKQGFLSPQGLRELASIPGVTIGAHGNTHIPLAECHATMLNDELLSSKQYLEDVLGQNIRSMSYPYGSVNLRVRDAAANVGYQLAACSHAGLNMPNRDRLLLRRTEIHGTDTIDRFRRKLLGDFDWYRWRHRDPVFS
jgi:peptidoglycan/xylan/chitin deacetylase (PgdA/CDA1 family)